MYIIKRNHIILFDDEDYELVSNFKWSITSSVASKTHYARCTKNNILMHRLILNAPKGVMIDHIDGNGLNNQKNNLRFCTNAQNQYNSTKNRTGKTSIYKGVDFCKKTQKWRAHIKINKRKIYLGSFFTEVGAAIAYNFASIECHKEFANLNKFKEV